MIRTLINQLEDNRSRLTIGGLSNSQLVSIQESTQSAITSATRSGRDTIGAIVLAIDSFDRQSTLLRLAIDEDRMLGEEFRTLAMENLGKLESDLDTANTATESLTSKVSDLRDTLASNGQKLAALAPQVEVSLRIMEASVAAKRRELESVRERETRLRISAVFTFGLTLLGNLVARGKTLAQEIAEIEAEIDAATQSVNSTRDLSRAVEMVEHSTQMVVGVVLSLGVAVPTLLADVRQLQQTLDKVNAAEAEILVRAFLAAGENMVEALRDLVA